MSAEGLPVTGYLPAAQSNFAAMKKAYGAGDVAKTSSLLAALKVALTTFPALPPLCAHTSTVEKELVLARDVLEYAALFAVSQDDHDAVERACTQLKTYYMDAYCVSRMKRSERQNLVTGLNLTRLLVQNRIAEFHTELELVPPETQADPNVKLPIELEQRLMEGSYDKILKQSKAALPSPEFGNFMTSLTATVKDEIAACMEKAYATLSAAAAAKMLGIGSGVEMNAFGERRGWARSPDGLRFVFQKEKAPPSAKDIESGKLIAQTMMYAKELERIV